MFEYFLEVNVVDCGSKDSGVRIREFVYFNLDFIVNLI